MTITFCSLRRVIVLSLPMLLFLASCQSRSNEADPHSQADGIEVIASTTIVADVVRNVGGQYVHVDELLPAGTDPHAFDLSPRDAARLSDAEAVFVIGLGFESFLQAFLDQADNVVEVSEGIPTLSLSEDESAQHQSPGGQTDPHLDTTSETGLDEHDVDPHVWFDPQNVAAWSENIQVALSDLDPAHAADFQANGETYRLQLIELDEWIQGEVAQIPLEQRLLITDHNSLGYFAERYDFELVGTVIPGYSTLAQPSARELAELSETVERLGVNTVFVGTTTENSLAEQLSRETGVRLIPLFIGSLSTQNGLAGTYLDFMRTNVSAIVDALHPSTGS